MYYNQDEAIALIEERNHIKFSEEQLKILRHNGGMYIVSCAGSGKTTVLVELITKRIMTREIVDPSKLLLTTYSKAGANEMTARINKQLEMFNISAKVQVKTMHAFYLQVLRKFGERANICYDAERYKYIRQACKEIKFKYEEEDIENLSNILSFQINNMMNDQAIYSSYVFNVDMTLEQYKQVRIKFNEKKLMANVMDFDDMQFKLYCRLIDPQEGYILSYCRDHWNSFYVDEFQDTNKIQFEILKRLVMSADDLVVIGDDDQCLIEGTKIKVGDSYELIENIKPGDVVTSAYGYGEIGNGTVESVSVHEINKPIVKITTESGRVLTGTEEHVMFVRDYKACLDGEKDYNNDCNKCKYYNNCIGKYSMDSIELFTSITKDGSSDEATSVDLNVYGVNMNISYTNYDTAFKIYNDLITTYPDLKSVCKTRILTDGHAEIFTQLKDVQIWDKLPVWTGHKFEYEAVVSKEILNYKGRVYDINVTGLRNYIANDVVVHNCIYSWRGADPNIILNICAYYDIKKFYLSTNYRCREEILRFAESGVKFMYNREKKDMIPFKKEGLIEFMNYKDKDLYGMEHAAFDYIRDLINGGTPETDICVIVRNNAHAAVLSNMLLMNGIYCDSSKEIKLSTTPEFKDLENLLEIAGNETIPQTYDKDICCSMLWKLVRYIGVQGGNVIYEFMDNTGLNFHDTLEYILANYLPSGVSCSRKVRLPNKVELKISARCYNFKTETVYSLCGLYNLLSKADYEERLKGLISLYIENMDFTLKDPNRRRVFEAFFKYVNEIIKNDGKDRLEEIMNTTKQYEKGETSADIQTKKVKLTTAHSAKGMEWKHVIILAYDNISFPPFKYIVDSLGKGVTKSDIASYIDGERRLAYVATTRAIDKLTIIGDFDNFSIFGLEALGLIEKSTVESVIKWADDLIRGDRRFPAEMRVNEERDINSSPKNYKLIEY